MPNNATRAGKRKRVVMEGGLDSDSGEERDVDIGVIVDGHGHSRVGRTLHISNTGRKRPQSLPALPSNSSRSTVTLPSTNQPSDEKRNRNQVWNFAIFMHLK